MSCSTCNNNEPQPANINQTCGIVIDSKWITNTDLVNYTGTNLTCVNVFTNDTLTTALQNIDTAICPVNMSTSILTAIQASPTFTATFANFVNQTLINCTTTTTSTSSTTTTTTTLIPPSTTTTTTTINVCTITTTTTQSIFTPICLSYNTLNCINACVQNVPGGCSTFYVTNACAANFTAGCQIYANTNYFPAPAGYYSYNGNCYVVTSGGNTVTTQSICSTSTTSTTSTTTTKAPFSLCFSPIGTSCYEACFCQDVTVLSFESYRGGTGQPQWKFTLSQPLSVSITISGADVRGFSNSNCTIFSQLDSMNLASLVIPAGQVSGIYNGPTLGISCSTTHYRKLNGFVISGGIGAVQNGDVVTIGGATVIIYIDLACNPYTC
jgi:hypothetical protein